MNKILKINLLALFFISTFLLIACEKEPINQGISVNDFVGKYKITEELVYSKNDVLIPNGSGGFIERVPKNLWYDSKTDVSIIDVNNDAITINPAKYYIIFNADKSMLMYDVDNEKTILANDPKYGQRRGTWNLNDRNTFDYNVEILNTSIDPNLNKTKPAEKYYCVITSFSKVNGKMNMKVTARLDSTTPIVKELTLVEDDTVVEIPN